MTTRPAAPNAHRIDVRIHVLRGQRILLDEDLAALYNVAVKALNQAVRRNISRFPSDFMFQLTADEHQALRSQSVTLEHGRGKHRKFLPHAFTEQGVAMLSGVLQSPRAVAVNIEIMRAFVRMRAMAERHADLAARIADLERKYDSQFKVVFDALRRLTAPPVIPKRPIGFRVDDGGVAGRRSSRGRK